MSAATDPVREHLDKAENWLMLAEGNRGELIDLHEGVGTYTEAEDAQRWYFSFMFESAKDLAEQHRAMAQTIYDLTPRRIVANAPDWAVDVEAMGDALDEKLRADAEEFDAQTLRPGADPEPVAEGELWATGDGWFYYAVREGDEAAPARAQVPRWLLVRHYAQVLRWNSEQGVKSLPATWSEVGADVAEEQGLPREEYGTLRRPTAEERAAFYGPEPDSEQPPPPGVENMMDAFTDRAGTALADLDNDDLLRLMNQIARALPSEKRKPERPRGGAGQWNG